MRKMVLLLGVSFFPFFFFYLSQPMEEGSSNLSSTNPIPRCRLQDLAFRKTIFWIRHGRSTWNEAKSQKDLKGFMARDHPLNDEGIDQCLGFNQTWSQKDTEATTAGPLGHDFTLKFLKAEAVLASPLTRALQTAIVSLHGHPAVKAGGITCIASAREIKGTTGFDCLGVAVGPEIRNRALEELGKIKGHDFADAFTTEVYPGDADVEWWTKTKDSKKSMEVRLEKFWDTIRAHPANSIIIVSHSNFMKEVLRSTGAHVVTDSVKLTDVLKSGSNKLDNASCLGSEYYFKGRETPVLITAGLIFGSKLVKQKEKSMKGKSKSDLRDLISAPTGMYHTRTGNILHGGDGLAPVAEIIFSHCDGKGTWHAFTPKENRLIEHAYHTGKKTFVLPYIPENADGFRLFEIRFGDAAVSSKMTSPPPTRIIQVNLVTDNTRVVKREDRGAAL